MTAVIMSYRVGGPGHWLDKTHHARRGDTTKQGKDMRDTIDMLEAIGSDASLRRASAEELTQVLVDAKASEALTAAVASGNTAALLVELGHREMNSPQISQVPGHDEEEEQPADDDADVVTSAAGHRVH